MRNGIQCDCLICYRQITDRRHWLPCPLSWCSQRAPAPRTPWSGGYSRSASPPPHPQPRPCIPEKKDNIEMETIKWGQNQKHPFTFNINCKKCNLSKLLWNFYFGRIMALVIETKKNMLKPLEMIKDRNKIGKPIKVLIIFLRTK